MQQYLYPWQLPILAAFAVIWLVGGAYLTRGALLKIANLPPKKASLGKAAGMNLTHQGAALVAMAVVSIALAVIGRHIEVRTLYVVGAVLGPLAMLGVSWAMHWALLELPPDKLIKMVFATSVPVLVLAVVFGLAMFLPARQTRMTDQHAYNCQLQLLRIHDALERYARRHPGRPAENLQTLADAKERYIEEKFLACPANPGPVGYLYAPLVAPDSARARQQICFCDKKGNHRGERMVLFRDGHLDRLPERQFQELVKEPQNRHILPLVEQEK